MIDMLVLPCESCGTSFQRTAWNKRFCTTLCKESTPSARERQALNRSLNRDRQRSYAKAHYAANRDTYIARARDWREENPERSRELTNIGRTRRYRANPAADLARQHTRRASMLGSYTTEEWNAIPFNNKCSYCGTEGKMTVDHVVSVSSGGPNTIENIVPACGPCNTSKHDNSLIYYLAQRSA